MQQHKLWVYYLLRRNILLDAGSCSNSPLQLQRSHSAWTSNLSSDYDKEQTSSPTSLEARWHVACWAWYMSRPLETHGTFHHSFENAYLASSMAGHSYLCTRHCNSDQLVVGLWTCSRAHLYALQIRTWTIIIRKMMVWKMFFVVIVY